MIYHPQAASSQVHYPILPWQQEKKRKKKKKRHTHPRCRIQLYIGHIRLPPISITTRIRTVIFHSLNLALLKVCLKMIPPTISQGCHDHVAPCQRQNSISGHWTTLVNDLAKTGASKQCTRVELPVDTGSNERLSCQGRHFPMSL